MSIRELTEMKSRVIRAALAAAAAAVLVPGAGAQEKDAKQEVQSQYDIGGMIEQAVRNISQRYNLNTEQHNITQKMMEEGVNRFLMEHADEIYPLIRDLTRAELNGRNLSVSQRKRVGQAAKPLIDGAKAEILRYNAEWREVLSQEQKRLHDWDLREMEGQFAQIHDSFDKMKEGLPVDNPIFPEPASKSDEPPRPNRPKKTPKPPPPVIARGESDVFDNYVEKFIKDYKLDAGQKATARSILKEYRAYADAYRQVKKDDYARARKQADQARKDHDIEKLKAAEKQIDKLNERISEFLAQMKERLMTIPRESQKRAYAEQVGQQPDQDTAKGDQGGADKPADQPSKGQAKPGQPSSQATATRPAEKTKEASEPRQ